MLWCGCGRAKKFLDRCQTRAYIGWDMEITPEAILQARERLGMSRTKFAGEIGVSGRSLDRWEKGEAMPTSPVIIASVVRMIEKAKKAAA